MSSVYDKKGKTFTQVVNKHTVPVIIQTQTNRIKGNMHLRESERIKDALNDSHDFIAVTSVVVFDTDGIAQIHQTEFMALNRANIVWVIEDEEGVA